MWLTIVLVVVVVAALMLWANARPPNFPPGPISLPFLGNIIYILFKTHKVAFSNYRKTYGGIFSYQVFNKWAVVISDPGLMKTALADPAFSGRPAPILFSIRDKILTGNTSTHLGILTASGEVWKNQRRYTLRTLKDLGLGRQTLEPIMQNELEELLEYFKRNQGKKIDIGLLFNRSIVNVLWAIVIGSRFSHSDAKLQELVDKVNKMLQTYHPYHPALRLSWVKKIFPNLDIIQKTQGYMKDLLEFIEGQMAKYTEQTGGMADWGSYIGQYQQGMEEAAREGRDTPLSMAHLKANILELFFAGSETTSTTLWWAIYLLASNPEVQVAMQEELDRVVGPDHLPTLAQMDSLPYCTATVYEVQRAADFLPFAVPHETIDDAEIGGYRIPKGTHVRFNLSHCMKDPKYWEAPDKFRPQHFLTDDGKVFKPDHFMPFGFGKRVCLGESLAKLELFLFLTTLIHRFSWRLSDDPVVWVANPAFNRAPDFTVLATSRNDHTKKE